MRKRLPALCYSSFGQIEQVFCATGKPVVSEQGAIGGDSGTKNPLIPLNKLLIRDKKLQSVELFYFLGTALIGSTAPSTMVQVSTRLSSN